MDFGHDFHCSCSNFYKVLCNRMLSVLQNALEYSLFLQWNKTFNAQITQSICNTFTGSLVSAFITAKFHKDVCFLVKK